MGDKSQETYKNGSTNQNYNPFEHRQVQKPNSDIRSTANLLKASLGSGLLAVPLAFSNAGWAVGLVGTFVIAFVCTHCVHILVKTSRGCCKLECKPLLGYAATCEAAFAHGPKMLRRYSHAAKIFAEFSLFFTHVGICCVYTVLIADSVKQLIDRYVLSTSIDVQYYCLALSIPLLLLSQIKYLKWLAPFSLVANVLLVCTFAICLYYIFGDTISFEGRKVTGDISRFPAFLSTVIFAMEGIGIVMPVENSMSKPEHFLGCPGVLVIAMSLLAMLYATLGLFGYMRYGDVLRGSITLNLPINDWPAVCAKAFIAVSIFFTYPLQFYVIIDIFKRYTEPHYNKKYHTISEIIARTVGVCICGAIGMALPMLEQIISFVGAFFYSILGVMVPCIVETVFNWENLVVRCFALCQEVTRFESYLSAGKLAAKFLTRVKSKHSFRALGSMHVKSSVLVLSSRSQKD
ncbi:Proton-coupled amino acid transporter-like protein CG1139 [Eumeta japonica]|uniref:Proton-coupled amino acid transporter-like protein CG1139 n=1 Tax=Eumeta variegata TaxID=151549 RepID=A0A4C1XNC6_EUMVA|nr:Proton-coupled amino acid transporter-like protein CG1139 [Eumeta japonica]